MCVHKSALYTASLRATGVPSRLALTDVCNHLASARLRKLVGGDVFHLRCFSCVHTGQDRVGVCLVFKKTLCRLYAIATLDFDGTTDSVHHPLPLASRSTWSSCTSTASSTSCRTTW